MNHNCLPSSGSASLDGVVGPGVVAGGAVVGSASSPFANKENANFVTITIQGI